MTNISATGASIHLTSILCVPLVCGIFPNEIWFTYWIDIAVHFVCLFFEWSRTNSIDIAAEFRFSIAVKRNTLYFNYYFVNSLFQMHLIIWDIYLFDVWSAYMLCAIPKNENPQFSVNFSREFRTVNGGKWEFEWAHSKHFHPFSRICQKHAWNVQCSQFKAKTIEYLYDFVLVSVLNNQPIFRIFFS